MDKMKGYIGELPPRDLVKVIHALSLAHSVPITLFDIETNYCYTSQDRLELRQFARDLAYAEAL